MKKLMMAALLLLLIAPIQAQDNTPEPVIALWDGTSPLTILVAGLDRRPGQRESLNVRTDAIMLLHFDPTTQRIGVLHIPRDLFFALPPLDNGTNLPMVRVNTLVLRGEGLQEGYGPYHMMDIIGYNLGIYIDGFILFDFEAFIAIVDALGGVEITINYNISDPTYPDMHYGYDPFYLRAGTHLLDGETALKFARTRHGDNDYLRGYRQLTLIRAIGEKATSADMLPLLLVKAPDLLEALEGKLYTDLTITDGLNLAVFASGIPLESIQTGSINEAYITYTINEGDSVAIPDRTKLNDLLSTVFGAEYGG